METNTLFIKNMVCPRCITAVAAVLKQHGLKVEEVSLGEARVEQPLPPLHLLDEDLQKIGFELIYEKEKQLAEQIKGILIDYLQHLQTAYQPITTSAFLVQKTGQNYQYLSKLFSKFENLTIEKYFIRLRIERVKELLSYRQLTLSEIAWELKYSSVQHLSNQFKKVTGSSVSTYKSGPKPGRIPLNNLSSPST
jgi:AraC family transcriptional regulator